MIAIELAEDNTVRVSDVGVVRVQVCVSRLSFYEQSFETYYWPRADDAATQPDGTLQMPYWLLPPCCQVPCSVPAQRGVASARMTARQAGLCQ